MYSTSVYQYIPRQIVVLNVGDSPRRYNTVYSKNLKLHKGADNRIQFQFLNQEQKPIDITGKEITIRIINSTNSAVLLRKALTPILPLTGITELQLPSSELDGIISQKATYSIEIPVDSFNVPVFVAGDGGARGMIEIVDGILPAHTPSIEIGIATHAIPSGTEVTYYSDVLNTSYAQTLSIQPFLTNFTGTIIVKGSTVPNAEWYDIMDATYIETSDTDLYNIEGFHPYIKVAITSTSGEVDKLLAR